MRALPGLPPFLPYNLQRFLSVLKHHQFLLHAISGSVCTVHSAQLCLALPRNCWRTAFRATDWDDHLRVHYRDYDGIWPLHPGLARVL